MVQSRSYEEYSRGFVRVFESVCHSYCDDSGVFALLESDLLVDFDLFHDGSIPGLGPFFLTVTQLPMPFI